LDRQLYFYTDYAQVKQNIMKNDNSQENLTILLLGTGGTIAGLGDKAYKAAQLPVTALVPASKHRIVSEQIAQIDSKDMSFEIWEQLYARIFNAQNDPAIHAIVITHGTDTLEETAYFLHRALVCTKAVILTGAMRPADAVDGDGSHNMTFAIEQAEQLSAGVWVAFAGRVFSGGNVQKVHPTRLDAFDVIDEDKRGGSSAPLIAFKPPIKGWPRVEIVMSYAGAGGTIVDALIKQKVDGIVVAGTGNSTVHHDLESKLDKARDAGVAINLCSRSLIGCALQARVDLMLRLMLERT
jgi:L-asparaginase